MMEKLTRKLILLVLHPDCQNGDNPMTDPGVFKKMYDYVRGSVQCIGRSTDTYLELGQNLNRY